MTPTSLDNQSGAADDTHIVRIVRLETQMDNVTSALISLQRTQEQNHLAMTAQLDALRTHIASVNDKIDKQIAGVNDRSDRQIDSIRDSMDKQHWEMLKRMDRQFYWLTGLVVTNMIATTGILVRLASM